MNRHHPYGGFEHRRGGSPSSGPGPDRYQRFQDRGGGAPRGRGGGRGGRGGYSNYDANANVSYGTYDQGPPQGDTAGYNVYETAPQDFYQNDQNASYSSGLQSQFSAGSLDGYNQGYGKFEGALEP